MSGVTDHALVRWLERVRGLDVARERAECAAAVEDLVASGASGGWIKGQWCVVKNGQVVTFMPNKPSNSMRVRHGNLDDTGYWP
jgi:hypothetical protein